MKCFIGKDKKLEDNTMFYREPVQIDKHFIAFLVAVVILVVMVIKLTCRCLCRVCCQQSKNKTEA